MCEDCPVSDGVEEEDVDSDANTAKVFPAGNVEYPKTLNYIPFLDSGKGIELGLRSRWSL